MEVLLGIFIAIAGVLVVSVLRSLTTFFHEMGHALPALLFTEGPVFVYIGTYGDVSSGVHLSFGRLQIFFRLNLLDWKLGMCQHHAVKSKAKSAIILLGGPMASLLISIPLLLLLLNVQFSETLSIVLAMFIFAATVDFMVNMIPWNQPIQMDGGGVSYCDGYQLLNLIRRSNLSATHLLLEEKLEDQKYKEVMDEAEQLILNNKADKVIYEIAIEACILHQKPKDGLWFFEKKNAQMKLNSYDYFTIATFYIDLKNDVEALKCLNHFLDKVKDSPEGYKARGCIYLRLKNYELASKDFQLAFYYNQDDPVLLMYRGIARINSTDTENGLNDLKLAESKGIKSPEMYSLLENYYTKIGDEKLATEYYWKNQKSR